MSEDLKELVSSMSDEELEQYSKFKKGEIKLMLIGSCSRGYDEADKWEYWCHGGNLFLSSSEEKTKKLDKKLIPIVFFNPLFKRNVITPYSQIFEEWKKVQEGGKFKMMTVCLGTPKYMYDLKDDHLLRYVREENGINEYKIDQRLMFHFFQELPSEKSQTITKEEFMKLGGLKIVEKRSPPRRKRMGRAKPMR